MVELKRSNKFKGIDGPLLTIVMDGVGIAPDNGANAVAAAHTPTLDMLMKNYPTLAIKAHGTAVGLPGDDDMGNSEVGHNALGSGQVFAQGAKLVSQSIESGKIFASDTWKALVEGVKKNSSTLHFLGLFSDGNVHSHIDHLKALITEAKASGVSRVRVHILLDGRDVGETSALDYVLPFEDFLSSLRSDFFDIAIASGGGRMQITMDRYEANWGMVEAGWKTHVLGEGRQFASAEEAITTYREETKVIDQDLPPFVISDDGKTPVGAIKDGDAVVYFNFRGDRALEISEAFDSKDFTPFKREPMPSVYYAGMMEYDGDLHIPNHYLVNPPEITETLSEYLCTSGVSQFAISETQKYGHVTYFFNGNRSGKFNEALETYQEVPSDVIPFEQRPWMQCAEITDTVIAAIESGKYQFIRLNYPNGDMVGHTGNYQAVQISMGALDLCLQRLAAAVEKAGGILVATADHGNADDMYEHAKDGSVKLDKKTGEPARKTSHSLNPVPCFIYDPENKGEYKAELRTGLGISSVAATCAELLGFEAPADYDPSVIEWK